MSYTWMPIIDSKDFDKILFVNYEINKVSHIKPILDHGTTIIKCPDRTILLKDINANSPKYYDSKMELTLPTREPMLSDVELSETSKFHSLKLTLIKSLDYMLEHPEHKRFYLPLLGTPDNVISLAWIGKYKKVVLSDSLSYKDNFIYFLNLYGTLKKYEISPEVKKSFSINYCACPVCALTKYLGVYAIQKSFDANVLRYWHNMVTLVRQSQYWTNMARRCDIKEYLHWSKIAIKEEGVKSSSKKALMLDKINFVEYAQEFGLDKARKKFRIALNHTGSGKSIFDLYASNK